MNSIENFEGNPSEPWEVSADLLIPFETEETKPMKIIETKEILIQDLKHHPKNHDIYGKWEDVSDLEQSLTGYGQTRPIIVNKNLEILSGNRRLIAAKNIGMLTLACEVREFDNEVFELEFLLIENIQRAKNTEQKVREGQIWKEIETSRAKERQRRNKNETQITQGAVRDILAEKVGLGSGYNFQKAEKIVIEIDKLLNNGEAKKAEDLREALNKSVNRGTELLKEWEQKSTSLIDDSEIVDDTVEEEEDFFEKIKSQQKAEMNTISAMTPSKDTLKQYRFISKSSVWGQNGTEKVELKPDTIVAICNDESVSQALVYPIEMKDARFFIDRVSLCLISDLEVIEGIWRDRMSLSLASNPTPRTEAQFYCCTSLTDYQNLDFSKRRLKKINLILADIAKDFLKGKASPEAHKYEQQLVIELKTEEKFQEQYKTPIEKPPAKAKAKIEKDPKGHYFKTSTDAFRACKINEGDTVRDKLTEDEGIILSKGIAEIGMTGDISYFINYHVKWDNGSKSHISSWYIEKVSDRPKSLLECENPTQVTVWFDNLVKDHPDMIKKQLLQLHSEYLKLKTQLQKD